MANKKLPTGIQSFREIREEGMYYVDKTEFAKRLIDGDKHNFLSRPRRFGKSLFVNTLKALFEGKKDLFKGLYIHDKWDWGVEYPVLRLDFTGATFKDVDRLERHVVAQLDTLEEEAELSSDYPDASDRFAYLIRKLADKKKQRVVILVDEYDKPILDALETPGNEDVASANRDTLKEIYSNIKRCDDYIKFTFLTGVSKFAHAGIFSGLNNLNDITLDPDFSSICGYTDHDIDTVFAQVLGDLDRDKIRKWYNGYNWRGDENVYNPYSILKLFSKREFESWWFPTGTPSFLIEVLKKRRAGTLGLAGMRADGELMSSIDIDSIKTPALLFQTGYLTIAREVVEKDEKRYLLDFPNYEVRESLHQKLIEALTPETESEARGQPARLREALETGDFAVVKEILHAQLSGLAHDSYRNNRLDEYEGHYSTVVHTCMEWTGLVVRPEDPTSHGNIDLTVEAGTRIVIFEFKVLRPGVAPGEALQQIRDKNYADKYRGHGVPIHLIGVEFDPEDRNIKHFDIETIQPTA